MSLKRSVRFNDVIEEGIGQTETSEDESNERESAVKRLRSDSEDSSTISEDSDRSDEAASCRGKSKEVGSLRRFDVLRMRTQISSHESRPKRIKLFNGCTLPRQWLYL